MILSLDCSTTAIGWAAFEDDNLIINSLGLKSCELEDELTKELRSSIFLLGSLVSRTGCAKLAYPGGCDIGLRPIDLHIFALKQLIILRTSIIV